MLDLIAEQWQGHRCGLWQKEEKCTKGGWADYSTCTAQHSICIQIKNVHYNKFQSNTNLSQWASQSVQQLKKNLKWKKWRKPQEDKQSRDLSFRIDRQEITVLCSWSMWFLTVSHLYFKTHKFQLIFKSTHSFRIIKNLDLPLNQTILWIWFNGVVVG